MLPHVRITIQRVVLGPSRSEPALAVLTCPLFRVRITTKIRPGIQIMANLSVAENIIPIGEFKTQASRLLRQVSQTARPLVITQNGRPAGVLLSPTEYDRLRSRERLLESIAAGIADADRGRLMDAVTLRGRLATRRVDSGADQP